MSRLLTHVQVASDVRDGLLWQRHRPRRLKMPMPDMPRCRTLKRYLSSITMSVPGRLEFVAAVLAEATRDNIPQRPCKRAAELVP